MGSRTQASIDINASPAEIWPYMTDLDLELQWVPALAAIEPVDGRPDEVGFRTRATYKLNRQVLTQKSETTAIEIHRMLETTTKVGHATIIQRRDLVQRDRITTVTWSSETFGLGFAQAVWAEVVRPFTRMNLQQVLSRLKAKVEDPQAELERVDSFPGNRRLATVQLIGIIVVVLAAVTLPSILPGRTSLMERMLPVVVMGAGALYLHRLPSQRARARQLARSSDNSEKPRDTRREDRLIRALSYVLLAVLLGYGVTNVLVGLGVGSDEGPSGDWLTGIASVLVGTVLIAYMTKQRPKEPTVEPTQDAQPPESDSEVPSRID